MIESLLAVMTSSGFGAVTGGFFGWLNRREDRKARQADQDFELERIDRQSTADIQHGEVTAFVESQKTLSQFGDAVKSAVRPVITGILMWMLYEILQELHIKVGGLDSLPPAEQAVLYREITLNIICLASTAVSWWFAARPTAIKGTT